MLCRSVANKMFQLHANLLASVIVYLGWCPAGVLARMKSMTSFMIMLRPYLIKIIYMIMLSYLKLIITSMCV